MIRLLLGDCLKEMEKLDDDSIDLVLTDPPYGVTAAKWDSVIPLELMWAELKRVTKPNGIFALCGTEPFSSVLRLSNLDNYKYDWVWNKITATGHLLAKHRPMKQHELISIFGGAGTLYNPQMIDLPPEKWTVGTEVSKSELYGSGKVVGRGYSRYYKQKYPKSIQSFKVERGLHPTQKPVPLMGYLIRTYTNKGDTVLDFAMGSGTTGVAAKVLSRNFVGIEIDEEYFEAARGRIIGAHKVVHSPT